MRNIQIYRGVDAPLSNVGSVGSYYYQEVGVQIVIWRKVSASLWTAIAAIGLGSGGVGSILHGSGLPSAIITEPLNGMHYIDDDTNTLYWYNTTWIEIAKLNGEIQWQYQTGSPLVVPPSLVFEGLNVVDVETMAVWNYDGANWTIQGYLDRRAVVYGTDKDDYPVESRYAGMLYLNVNTSELHEADSSLDWQFVSRLGGSAIIHGNGEPNSETEPFLSADNGTHYVDDTTNGFYYKNNLGVWTFIAWLQGVGYKANGTTIGSPASQTFNIISDDPQTFTESAGEYTLDLTTIKSKSNCYITDITPLAGDNVFDKMYNSDGNVIDSCTVSNKTFIVSFLVFTGNTNLKPNAKLFWQNSPAGTSVTLSATSSKNLWTGTMQITINSASDIRLVHEDGFEDVCTINYTAPPEIQTLQFTGSYPAVDQTEYAEDDPLGVRVLVGVDVTADVPFIQLEIQNTGACNALLTSTFAATTSLSISTPIANRGTVTQALPVTARVKSAQGTWSDWFTSDSVGVDDHIYRVNLNNIRPTLTFGTIVYSSGFEALKDTVATETASVPFVLNGFTMGYDEISFTSPLILGVAQLSIPTPNTDVTPLSVARINGDYNITTPNLSVALRRKSNNTTGSASMVVQIAHVAPTLEFHVRKTPTTDYVRLRSGGSFGSLTPSYNVNLVSNQKLLAGINSPTWSASSGTLQVGITTSDRITWVTTLSIADTDAKGSQSFSALNAVNLAGKAVTTANNSGYVVGGFVERVVTFNPSPNREAPIGTSVVDASKLRATNLSKGATHTYNTTYTDEVTNDPIPGPFTYTITDGSGVFNATGSYVYNNDSANALGNTSVNPNDWIKFEIEEQE